MLTSDELRYACDVAQKRHTALVDLIFNNDRSAMGLMQLYITIASATTSGAAIIWFKIGSTGAPAYLAFVLLAIGIPCLFGAAHCFAAMWPSKINLPGTQPDVWLWADTQGEKGGDAALRIYLKRLEEGHARNQRANDDVAALMKAAKWSGILAPLLGILALFTGMMLG
jgi:hypothetical protein